MRKRTAGLSLENRVRPGGDKGAGQEGAAGTVSREAILHLRKIFLEIGSERKEAK